MPIHNTPGLIQFLILINGKVVDDVAQHLFVASKQINNFVKSQLGLSWVLRLEEVSTEVVSDAFLEHSLFDFREVIGVKFEIFDQF